MPHAGPAEVGGVGSADLHYSSILSFPSLKFPPECFRTDIGCGLGAACSGEYAFRVLGVVYSWYYVVMPRSLPRVSMYEDGVTLPGCARALRLCQGAGARKLAAVFHNRPAPRQIQIACTIHLR